MLIGLQSQIAVFDFALQVANLTSLTRNTRLLTFYLQLLLFNFHHLLFQGLFLLVDRAEVLVHALKGENEFKLKFDIIFGLDFLGVSKLTLSLILDKFLSKPIF